MSRRPQENCRGRIFAAHDDVIKWKHFPRYSGPVVLALCAWNSPVTVNSPNKGKWWEALMFSLIYAWINVWVNNRAAGDLRCHRAHYDVTVIDDALCIMFESGFGEAWYNQGVGDVNLFCMMFKTWLLDMYQQDWHSRLRASTRASFYRSFNDQIQFRSYLDDVYSKMYRVALTRLVISSHRLKIETGRWQRPVAYYIERTEYVEFVESWMTSIIFY